MSSEKHFTGKLIPTHMTLKELDIKAVEVYDLDFDAVELDGNVYKVVDKEDYLDQGDIFDLTPKEDGSFDFEVKYNNGGMGFIEALENSYEDMNWHIT